MILKNEGNARSDTDAVTPWSAALSYFYGVWFVSIFRLLTERIDHNDSGWT